MSILYHYTCRHAAQSIRATGRICPADHLDPALLPCRPYGYSGGPWFAWFTDLEPGPEVREALGLYGNEGAGVVFTDCDRLARVFTVDAARCDRWVIPKGWRLYRPPPWYVMPGHWFVSPAPVPILGEVITALGDVVIPWWGV